MPKSPYAPGNPEKNEMMLMLAKSWVETSEKAKEREMTNDEYRAFFAGLGAGIAFKEAYPDANFEDIRKFVEEYTEDHEEDN